VILSKGVVAFLSFHSDPENPHQHNCPESQIEKIDCLRGLPGNEIGFSRAVGHPVSASERQAIQGQKSWLNRICPDPSCWMATAEPAAFPMNVSDGVRRLSLHGNPR
jgi:hypothetical protein